MATREPAALPEFGHLLETFVVSDLFKQAVWLDDIALCAGERSYTFEDRLHVMPIDRVWA